MHKCFYLSAFYDPLKGKKAINDLNRLLSEIGISFRVNIVNKNTKELNIYINEERLQNATNKAKVGRKPIPDFDFDQIIRWQNEGIKNTEIIERLGVSKALFYKRMKEYKNKNRP